MMKLEDMEDADPRYATAVEVADLRRTLDDFMKKQQQRNDAIKTKLDKIMYSMEKLGVQDDGRIEDKASKVKVKDLPDTSECQMQDPFSVESMENADWEDCPWSASELEAFYENANPELPLENVHHFREPIKPPPQPKQPQQQQNFQTPLSTTTLLTSTVLNSASEPLQLVNAAILTAPPTTLHLQANSSLDSSKSGSSECSQKRYNINSTSAHSVSVVLPSLPPKVFVDKELEPYILHFEQAYISLKPPRSLVCLEDDNCHNGLVSKCAWIQCSYLLNDRISFFTDSFQTRPIPWPSFTSDKVVVANSISSVNYVLGNVSGCYSVALKSEMLIKFAVSLLLWNHAHISLLGALPVDHQLLHCLCFFATSKHQLFLDLDFHTAEEQLKKLLSFMIVLCYHGEVQCQVNGFIRNLSICSMQTIQVSILCAWVVLPSLDFHTMVHLENSLPLRLNCSESRSKCRMSFITYQISQLMLGLSFSIRMFPSYCAAIWLEINVKCCWMHWDTLWPVPITMHQKKLTCKSFKLVDMIYQ